MREIFAKSNEIVLGKRGEKNAVCVVFSIANWLRDYGEGDITLIHQRNGDTYPYPCVIEREGDNIRWVITATETAKAGRGKAELQLVQDGTIAKSITYVTRVLHSLAPPSENPPEPGEGWIEKILELINNGGGGCDCEDGGGGGGGGGGVNGEDGGYYVPYVDPDGKLSWTPSKSGMPSVASSNIKGKDGTDGKDGKDGTDYELPIASANTLGGVKIGEGLAIDKNGVLSVTATVAEGLPNGDEVEY